MVIILFSKFQMFRGGGVFFRTRCRLQIITKTKHFRSWNVFEGMCRSRWSFWSWFDVNQSLLTKICAKNDFYIFVPS